MSPPIDSRLATGCGVNAHFQNGMAEKRIGDLQDQTTTMLLRAESKWPDIISANLWPYALREANEALNSTPSKVTGKVANQVFFGKRLAYDPQILLVARRLNLVATFQRFG